jgi:SNF family Na+-dependent transporter
MTVRELFNSIGVWLENTFTQTVIPYIREVLEVLLFQKNWLDASLVSVISVIVIFGWVIYGWVLGSLYNFITETLERIENEKEEYAEAPFYKRYQFLLLCLGWLIFVIAVFSIIILDGI